MKTANGYSNKSASDHAGPCDAVLTSTSRSGSHRAARRQCTQRKSHLRSCTKMTRASGSATFQILDGRGNFDERSVRKSGCCTYAQFQTVNGNTSMAPNSHAYTAA